MPIPPYMMIAPAVSATMMNIIKNNEDEINERKRRIKDRKYSNIRRTLNDEDDTKIKELEERNKQLIAELELNQVEIDKDVPRCWAINIKYSNCSICKKSKFSIKLNKLICLEKLKRLNIENCHVSEDNCCELYEYKGRQ